jgi:kynureninase
MASPNQDQDQDPHVLSREYAVSLDAQDPLRHLQDEFLIPSKAQLKATSLPEAGKKCWFDVTVPVLKTCRIK